MGFFETIKSGISRAIYKGVKHAGTAVAGILASILLKKFNFPLSDEHQLEIAIAITGALGSALKLLKDKFPKQLGWL